MTDDQDIPVGIVRFNDRTQRTLTSGDQFLSGLWIRLEVKIVRVERFVTVIYVDVHLFELIQLSPYWAVRRLPISCLTKAFAQPRFNAHLEMRCGQRRCARTPTERRRVNRRYARVLR